MKFKTLLTLLIFNGLGSLFAQASGAQTPASPYFLVPYRVKNLWGFSDQQGNIKIKPVYSAVGKISYYWTDGKEFKSLMEVVKGNRRFVINHLNEIVVPPEKEFDSFSFDSYSYETIIATKNGKKALYYDGKELLPCSYDDIERTRNLSFKMRTGNLNGLVNSTGNIIVPQKFYFLYAEKIEDKKVTWGASNDLKGKKESFTDIKIRDTIPSMHELGSVSINSTLSLLTSGGHLNLDSTIKALSVSYQDIKPNKNYSFLIHISKNGKKGLYNAITQKLIIPADYELINIDQGLNAEIIILVKKNFYGFFNDWGKMIVPPVIEAVYEKRLPLTLVKDGLVGMLTESVHYIKPKYKKMASTASLRDFNAGKIFNLYEVETATGQKGFVGNNGFEYFQN